MWSSLIFYVIYMNNLFFYKFLKFRNALLKMWVFVTVLVLFHFFCHPLIILVAYIIFSCAVFCDERTAQIGPIVVVPSSV